MEILDVLNARLDMAAQREQIEDGEAKITKHVLSVIFAVADPTEILTAIENATWMDKTVHEVGHPKEGVDNDGLTEAEVNEAMAEQDR